MPQTLLTPSCYCKTSLKDIVTLARSSLWSEKTKVCCLTNLFPLKSDPQKAVLNFYFPPSQIIIMYLASARLIRAFTVLLYCCSEALVQAFTDNKGKIYLTYIDPAKTTCDDSGKTSYFDTSLFTCIPCGQNQEAESSHFNQCKCLPNYKLQQNTYSDPTYFQQLLNKDCVACNLGDSGCPEKSYSNDPIAGCTKGTTLMKMPVYTDLSGLYCLPCHYGIPAGYPCICASDMLSVYPYICLKDSDSLWSTKPQWAPYTKDSGSMTSSFFKCYLPTVSQR